MNENDLLFRFSSFISFTYAYFTTPMNYDNNTCVIRLTYLKACNMVNLCLKPLDVMFLSNLFRFDVKFDSSY